MDCRVEREPDVLVTGGRERIGAAIARALARRGHGVVIHHHQPHDEMPRRWRANSIRGRADRDGDGRPGRCRKRPPRCSRRHASVMGGPIDGLVNSASVFEFDRPPDFDVALLATSMMRGQSGAPVALASALAEQDDLRRRRGGQSARPEGRQPQSRFLHLYLQQGRAGRRDRDAGAGARAARPRQRGLARPDAAERRPERRGVRASVRAQNLLQRPVAIDDVARDGRVSAHRAAASPARTCSSIAASASCKRDGDVMFRRPAAAMAEATTRSGSMRSR